MTQVQKFHLPLLVIRAKTRVRRMRLWGDQHVRRRPLSEAYTGGLVLGGLCFYTFGIPGALLTAPLSWPCCSYFSIGHICCNLVSVPVRLHLFKFCDQLLCILHLARFREYEYKASQDTTPFIQILSFFRFTLSQVWCLAPFPSHSCFSYHVTLTACSS